jgi:ribosomal protein S11
LQNVTKKPSFLTNKAESFKTDFSKQKNLIKTNAPLKHQYCCVVRFSMKKNNIFVNLTSLKGQTILKFSAGLIQKRKTKKELRSIVKFIIDKLSFFIKANFDCVKIIIKSDGSAKKALSLFKYFKRKRLKIVYFKAHLPIVHNGCRAPKKRRI